MLDITVATVSDDAVRIFSLFQKDVVADQGLQCFLDDSEVIWAEFFDEKVVENNFSQTNILGFLDFLLEDYLREVKSSEVDLNILSCMPKIKEHLVFLKYFMGKFVELRNQQEKLHQDVWNLAIQIAYKIEFLIDQLVLGDVLDSFSISLRFITLDIMFLKKADSLNIFNDEGRQEIFEVQQITYPSADKVLSISSRPLADEAVGFEKEKASIINQLVTGFKKLQTVAIIGMPGLGKTTLATKVYSSSSISLYFHVKAQCSISQVFDRRKVLLELINQIQPEKNVSTMNEDDLSQQLWRSLKRRKYLIFIDDIWDTKAFDLLKESLPDDLNQSRILLTSRHDDIVPRDVIYDKPFFLRHLNLDESLELLQRKLFPTQKDWPLELHEFGVEIAEYCKGLALTVVIIAGLLRTTEQEGWKNVLKMLRSSIISDVTDQCGSTIELSYKHLPNHLKACFLWFGAFPKGSELSVKRMIFLWISEGFVRKNESMSLEDVGRDCINNLISRSLVMSAEKSSGGGVKTFRIHDLLHDFCMSKANEEYFLHFLKGVGSKEQGGVSSDELETTLIAETENLCSVESRNVRRLCIYSKPSHLKWKVFCPRLRSLLFLHSMEWSQKLDLSYIFRMFKLLRVLSISSVNLTGFPSEISALVQLRYLEIQVDGYVGPEIGNLSKLEILILSSTIRSLVLDLPSTLWNLQKLRHLYYKEGFIELPNDDSNDSCNLLELQTLSTLHVTDLSVLEKQLRKFPNLRRMKCKIMDFSLHKDGSVNDSMFMGLSFLSQLESLSINRTPLPELAYPENIKKLNLFGTKYPWHKIASIAKLPHLEVLKLLKNSFVGDTWHVEEGDFPGLKFLKFQSLNLVKWTAASDDLFSNLEKLVLTNCSDLEEVPECLHYVAKLDTIEVINCGDRVVSLLKSVKEFQKEMGNSSLHFHQQQQNWQSSLDDDDLSSSLDDDDLSSSLDDDDLSGDE